MRTEASPDPALALADMRIKRAKDKLIDVLKRPETKGYRGTILYALDELGVKLPLSLLVDLIVQDPYEAREEALDFLASGKIDYDEDLHQLKQKLRTSLQSADEERSHAVSAALEYLNGGKGAPGAKNVNALGRRPKTHI